MTCPVQANMITGKLPARAWRRRQRFLLARPAAKSKCGPPGTIASQRPQIWDILHERDRSIDFGRLVSAAQPRAAGRTTSARRRRSTIPTAASRSGATPRPRDDYGELRAKLGHFPLQHFWGPIAEHQVDRLDRGLGRPHGRRSTGPTSSTSTCRTSTTPRRRPAPTAPPPAKPCAELDGEIGKLVDGFDSGLRRVARCGSWRASTRSRRSITSPIRTALLREAGLLQGRSTATKAN